MLALGGLMLIVYYSNGFPYKNLVNWPFRSLTFCCYLWYVKHWMTWELFLSKCCRGFLCSFLLTSYSSAT
jgi:hypothetical protein